MVRDIQMQNKPNTDHRIMVGVVVAAIIAYLLIGFSGFENGEYAFGLSKSYISGMFWAIPFMAAWYFVFNKIMPKTLPILHVCFAIAITAITIILLVTIIDSNTGAQ